MAQHINSSRMKRQRRLQFVRSRTYFRESMQDRTDLYAVTFSSGNNRREATKRLKCHRRGVPCWDTDANHRLIVSRDCLRLFRGLNYHTARIITPRGSNASSTGTRASNRMASKRRSTTGYLRTFSQPATFWPLGAGKSRSRT